ncbi:8686_t:CDS:2, partial [Rhizophagus irregularis]
MTRVRKEQKTTMQNEAEVTKGREKNGVIKCDTPIQEYEAEADLNVISISDDELGPAFDDTLNDFSISGPFKLDYSTIMDNSEKICDDDHEIETE